MFLTSSLGDSMEEQKLKITHIFCNDIYFSRLSIFKKCLIFTFMSAYKNTKLYIYIYMCVCVCVCICVCKHAHNHSIYIYIFIYIYISIIYIYIYIYIY